MDKNFCRKYKKMQCGLLHLLLIVGGATGLKDLTINVPTMVRSGDTVTLSCHYDLEGLSLYRIQWLFNDQEFFRYVPERKSSYNTFNVTGIQVNVSKSNSHDVTLVDVCRELTGMYKCEVSAGSPSYHTLIERAKMEVVDAPKTDPAIRTEKERIAMGETLRANCTSGKSRPAPDVTWKLNGEFIENNGPYYIRNYNGSRDYERQSTISLIEFKVANSMFRKGYLHLRCTASISDVYRKSADIEISEDMPRIASITGESPPYGHQLERNRSSIRLESSKKTARAFYFRLRAPRTRPRPFPARNGLASTPLAGYTFRIIDAKRVRSRALEGIPE